MNCIVTARATLQVNRQEFREFLKFSEKNQCERRLTTDRLFVLYFPRILMRLFF